LGACAALRDRGERVARGGRRAAGRRRGVWFGRRDRPGPGAGDPGRGLYGGARMSGDGWSSPGWTVAAREYHERRLRTKPQMEGRRRGEYIAPGEAPALSVPPPGGPEDYYGRATNGASEPPESRFRLIPFNTIKLGNERPYLVKGLIPRVGMTVVWG